VKKTRRQQTHATSRSAFHTYTSDLWNVIDTRLDHHSLITIMSLCLLWQNDKMCGHHGDNSMYLQRY